MRNLPVRVVQSIAVGKKLERLHSLRGLCMERKAESSIDAECPCDGVWTAIDQSKNNAIVLQQLLKGCSGHYLVGRLSEEQLGVSRNLHMLDDTCGVAARAVCAGISGTVGGKICGRSRCQKNK